MGAALEKKERAILEKMEVVLEEVKKRRISKDWRSCTIGEVNR